MALMKALFVAATALALATCARAQSVADFYRGKQINLVIGTSAGNEIGRAHV